MEDLISKLRHFSKLDFQSKQEVIKTGRPTPELRGLLQKTRVGNRRETTRSFQTDWYTRKDWLCGCAIKNRLFCFPCLLFSTSETVWTHTGFCDLKNLPRSLDKHERSAAHIQNQVKTQRSQRTTRGLLQQSHGDLRPEGKTNGLHLQVKLAAIMEVLAQAAVSEILQLVEDGGAALREEMRGKDGEIQELRASLKLLEAQLCRAQQAASTRTAEDMQGSTQVIRQDKMEDQTTLTMFLEQKPPDSLCDPQNRMDGSLNISMVVKSEPVDDVAASESTNCPANAEVCFEAGQEDSIWAASACSIFDKSSVAMQQQIPMFSSHTEQYSNTNTDASCSSLSNEAEETSDNCLVAPIIGGLKGSSVCVGNAGLESVKIEEFGHVSHPSMSQNKCSPSTSRHAGSSPVAPHAQRSSQETLDSHTEDPSHNRNNLRSKRVINVWRSTQKLFSYSMGNKGFPRLPQSEEHKTTSQPVKPFRCLECGKYFTQKTRLKTHQRVHTGERPYSCTICGKMFSRQDNCLRHERFHSGLKPFSCRLCGKSFTMQRNLTLHQEIHLRGR